MHDKPDRRYTAVRNRDGQYSLWPTDTPPPTGWVATGPTGSRDETLAHIGQVWTDQCPGRRAG